MMIEIDFSSDEAIYIQLTNQIIMGIATSRLREGDTLPSVRQLAVKLGVNPNTIQKAYQILESSGVIYSVKGKGSFISDDAAADTAVIKAAKRDFRAAVTAANELGLKSEELHGIVNEVCKEAENND